MRDVIEGIVCNAQVNLMWHVANSNCAAVVFDTNTARVMGVTS